MTDITPQEHRVQQTKKLRSACDACHQCKVKCPGGSPCSRCISKGLVCRYGYQNRAGKPKGSKNKKTLERQRQMQEAWLAQLSPSKSGESMVSMLDSDQSTITPPSSTILDDTDWFQSSALYNSTSSSSSVVFSPRQMSLDEAIYINPSDSVLSSQILEPWTLESDFSMNKGSADLGVDNTSFTAPLSLTNGSDVSSDDNDLLPALSIDLNPASSGSIDQKPTSCSCMQKQAANVASLDQIKSSTARSHDRFDTIMGSVTTAIDSCVQFVDCGLCEKSFSSVILTLSVVNLIFLILKQSFECDKTSGHESIQSQIPCFIGSYKTSNEEQRAIQKILLEMIFTKGRHALNALSGLVGTPEESSDSDPTPGAMQTDEESGMKRGIHGLSMCDRDYVVSYIARMKTMTAEVMDESLVTP